MSSWQTELTTTPSLPLSASDGCHLPCGHMAPEPVYLLSALPLWSHGLGACTWVRLLCCCHQTPESTPQRRNRFHRVQSSWWGRGWGRAAQVISWQSGSREKGCQHWAAFVECYPLGMIWPWSPRTRSSCDYQHEICIRLIIDIPSWN